MERKYYTKDGRHPEDVIHEVKTFINELQKVQELYFSNLSKSLNLNKQGDEFLFDYIYNSDEPMEDFEFYLESFSKKYESMVK